MWFALSSSTCFLFFFFSLPPAPTDIYTLSLHDALPIYDLDRLAPDRPRGAQESDPLHCLSVRTPGRNTRRPRPDRKSTRLNSSHVSISYAVFCLKKKKTSMWSTA